MAHTLLMVPLALAASAATINSFEIVGNSGASAQQMFLTTERTVQIVDKTERNGNPDFTIGGHPAWSAEYDIELNTATPRDIITNSFCAGGGVLANGTWVNVGGNQAVGLAGNTAAQDVDPYFDTSGGATVRLLDTCPENGAAYCSAEWSEWTGMPTNRWYPTLETLANGAIMIIGGELNGGYVDSEDEHQNVPNYEFFPSTGAPVGMDFLTDAQPLSLFPLTWLLPSGNLFMQAGNIAQLYNVVSQAETRLPNIPGGQRVYPASAGSTSLPMTPENGYNLTAIFCGGLDVDINTAYDPTTYNVTAYIGTQSCQTMTPDISQEWVATDNLIQGTVMLNLINLPDGRLFGLNGCAMGTAGYGWQDFGNGQGYGREPRLLPAGYYNHSAPAGSRWSNAQLSPSTIPRLYHSSATLLPDGSILVAGSNPNADFIGNTTDGQSVNATDPYWTEYRVERFYPDYYNNARPAPANLPSNISYGGEYFTITLPASNITSVADLESIKVVLIRTGFSTHSTNFGQRHVELPVTYTWNLDGSATINVGQLPPNANILAPGPVLFFVMLNGTPSVAKFVTVGTGQVETQPTYAPSVLPPNNLALPNAQASASAASLASVASASASRASTSAAASAAASHTAHEHSVIGTIAGAAAGGAAALLALIALVFCLRRRRNRASRGAYKPAGITRDIGYPTKAPYGSASVQSSQQDLLASNRRPNFARHSSSTLGSHFQGPPGLQHSPSLPYADHRSSTHSSLFFHEQPQMTASQNDLLGKYVTSPRM